MNDRCWDCGQPCDDTVCATCLSLAAEAEYAARYCREHHGGPQRCSCAEEAEMAYEAHELSPLALAVSVYCEVIHGS